MSLFWEIEKRDHRNHDIDVDIAAVYNHQCSFPCNCSHLLFRNFHEVVGYYLVVIGYYLAASNKPINPICGVCGQTGTSEFPEEFISVKILFEDSIRTKAPKKYKYIYFCENLGDVINGRK